MKTVTLIGIGRLGGAFARALSRAGYEIEGLVYHSVPPSDHILDSIIGRPFTVSIDELGDITSDILLITTGDVEIERAAASAAHFVNADTVVLHASGALSSEVLSAIAAKGCATGSIHPLVSISDAVRGADLLSKAYFCIEGSARATETARDIVASLGGRSFNVETAFKPLYHAAAVLASGHVISLFETAVETLTKCGVSRLQASEVLFPLISSAVQNLSQQDPAAALTGPFSRLDGPAIERHLRSFEQAGSADAKRIYIETGFKALDLAERSGAVKGEVDRIRESLNIALGQGRC